MTPSHNFAYVLRTAGVRPHGNEFELAYAVAIGGVPTHEAETTFDRHVRAYAIVDPVGVVVAQAAAIRQRLPRVLVAPLLYRVEDDRLVQIVEPGPA